MLSQKFSIISTILYDYKSQVQSTIYDLLLSHMTISYNDIKNFQMII